jgi:prepilin-type N-terminal cleavage/methylation domain-containing protein
MRKRNLHAASGFTLLEVLVGLTILAISAAIAISMITGSLINTRKVQLRTKIMKHAEEVMETALLDDTIVQPTSSSGSLNDGTTYTVTIDQYTPELSEQLQSAVSQVQNLQYQLLQYTVETVSPDSSVGNYLLQTLKMTKVSTTR